MTVFVYKNAKGRKNFDPLPLLLPKPLHLFLYLTVLCLCGNLGAVALGAALASLAALRGDGGIGLQFLGVFGSCRRGR